MLARRLTILLPAMRLAEALETTRIHRVAGPHRGAHRRRHYAPVPGSPPYHLRGGLDRRWPGVHVGGGVPGALGHPVPG
jgi:hypothetical protein